MAVFKRYSLGARVYDVVSGERLVYRAGRLAGVQALHLRRGDIVIDLGTGTGLNLPLLVEAVGPEGLVIAVDRSREMLGMARRRVARAGWANVVFVEADLLRLDWTRLAEIALERRGRARADAAFATYALSVIGDWRTGWILMQSAVRQGGRVGIVDMAVPTGWALLLAPVAMLACALGGADIRARPWQALERSTADVSHTTLRGAHLHVVTGTLP